MSIEKTSLSRQIIITCAPEDAAHMETLLAGMRVHSDFNVIRTTEIMRWSDAENPLPVLPVWVGFAHPGFAWDTLAGLLTSVPWKRGNIMEFYVEGVPHPSYTPELERYELHPDFIRLLKSGAFK